MQRVQNPFPIYLDLLGELLDAGYIYIGAPNADPEVTPITVYWNAALTVPAAQPLRTRGGIINNNGSPALVFAQDGDYSMRIRDADGDLVSYLASASASGGTSYQPLDADLTAIAALATTAFGRSLLTQATAAAARATLGVVNGLPLGGGTVTGNIVRGGAGPHLYYAGSATAGRVFRTPNTAADPTSQDGDIWIKYA